MTDGGFLGTDEPLKPQSRPEINIQAIEALLGDAMRSDPFNAIDVKVESLPEKKYFNLVVTSKNLEDPMLGDAAIRRQKMSHWSNALRDRLFPKPEMKSERDLVIAGSGLKIETHNPPTYKNTITLRFDFPTMVKKENFMDVLAQMGVEKFPPSAETPPRKSTVRSA